MRTFGDIVRLLMERRGLTGNRLAADIGLSATSVSKIVTGTSKPKQLTFSRLMKRLCTNPSEEQLMIRAFTGLDDQMAEEPKTLPQPLPKDEIERVMRYLEIKSMAIAFENDVEAALKEGGFSYEKSFRIDPLICDFMVTVAGLRVAIDCKYNVNRDWDRTVATIRILKEHLPCDRVTIVVPYENEGSRAIAGDVKVFGGSIAPLANLKEHLTSLTAVDEH